MTAHIWHRPSLARNRRALARLFLLALASSGLALGFQHANAATEGREGRNSTHLTVCGDPNNLPFSNQAREGFENRIAQLMADELKRPLHYRWWPQTIGFVRNTLRLRQCDLIMGITSVNEMVQNTNPYYRSVYSLVYRSDMQPGITSLTDPLLKTLRIGVVAGTPPATLLTQYGLMEQTRPYRRTVDTRHESPALELVGDVARGELDVALVWGPIAGFAATRETTPLTVVPLPARVDQTPLAFNVSMGIRHREKQWKHQVNALLERLQPRINEVLADYGVPLLDHNDKLLFKP